MKIILDYHKLTINKALNCHTTYSKTDLNRQIDNFVNPLKLFSRSTHITNIITDPLQNTNIINYNYTNPATSATLQPSTSPTPQMQVPYTQPVIQYKLTSHALYIFPSSLLYLILTINISIHYIHAFNLMNFGNFFYFLFIKVHFRFKDS